MDSLYQTKCSNFELLFVDYGSDESTSGAVKELLCNYPFVKYIYSDTRGRYWNRAHALNTGIKLASGNVIVTSDIDLIFPPFFIESVTKMSFENCFYTFKCYYLKEDADPVNVSGEDLNKARINYVGLCVVLKEDILKVSGFDEYYMIWGGEDDDLYVRLENNGCKRQQLDVQQFPVFHQWHPNHAPPHPTPWYLEMINYLYLGQQKEPEQNNKFGSLVKTPERTILNVLDQPELFKSFELYGNPWLQFNIFIIGFSNMAAGEFGQFEFPIKTPTVIPKGRKQKVIDKVNTVLTKWDFPYSMEKKIINVPEIHTRERWNEFVTYFIGKNRPLLLDYYLLDTDTKLALYFQKQ